MGGQDGVGIGPHARGGEAGDGVVRPVHPDDAAAVAGLPGPESDGIGATGVKPVEAIEFDFTDRRKRKWTGTFQNRVLTTTDRMTIGMTKAAMLRGLRVDESTDQTAEMLAHLKVSIVKAPEWAQDLGSLRAFEVVVALYQEVQKHEARFHGAEPG